jgi:fatty acid desaturase
MTLAAAFATANVERRSSLEFWTYRIALAGAAALVAAAGHLGGLLVWGADFLRP